MFNNSQSPKRVAITLVENTAVDGEHIAAGTTLLDVPGELAVELAGQGKARLATEAEIEGAEG
ncbi:hypothetical protein PSQ39_21410 [Curvibacter sp. HBC28]|uniref:Uncharacterized protein n=1 Tax=Curvibacter microcysteis TaxID=3026419 RepID=A0ABT5MKV1_9BURK|nr:hypothetical protein [Curvibacter sp. HBC28]MDD0817207.1 hypothetical protein [Curvibacter sp. HBC28]